MKHASQVAEGGLVKTTHCSKKAAHCWGSLCHWCSLKCGSRSFGFNICSKYTVNHCFHVQKICKQMLPPLERSAVLPLASTLRATVLIERSNDTFPAGMQAVLASSNPDALLNSPHPSTLQDCAGKIRSRFLLRFLALLLPTMDGNSKRNASLLCFGTSSVGRRQERGKQTWDSQKLHKQTEFSFQCGSEEIQRSGKQKEEGGL